MKALKTVMTGLLVVALNLAMAQGGKAVRPISPEFLEKSRRVAAAMARGDGFLTNGQVEEAISAFKEAVEIERTYGYPVSAGCYRLGKALDQVGRTDEALMAYKNAFWWNTDREEIECRNYAFGVRTPYVAPKLWQQLHRYELINSIGSLRESLRRRPPCLHAVSAKGHSGISAIR